MGGAYLYTEEFDEAFKVLDSARETAVGLGNRVYEGLVYLLKGIIYKMQSNTDEAITTLTEARTLFKETGMLARVEEAETLMKELGHEPVD